MKVIYRMKAILVVCLLLFVLVLVFLCFMWLLYHGSGHNIPVKTDISFVLSTLVNIAIIVLLWVIVKKVSTP